MIQRSRYNNRTEAISWADSKRSPSAGISVVQVSDGAGNVGRGVVPLVSIGRKGFLIKKVEPVWRKLKRVNATDYVGDETQRLSGGAVHVTCVTDCGRAAGQRVGHGRGLASGLGAYGFGQDAGAGVCVRHGSERGDVHCSGATQV